MQFRTFAEIATIVGATIAVLGYIKVEPNLLDSISGQVKDDVISDLRVTELAVGESDISGEGSDLFIQYRAALALESSYSRDKSLVKVVDSALKRNNFKIAILAGKEIESEYTKSNELTKIVDSALRLEEHAGHAVVAAEFIPSSYSKDKALEKIVAFYEHGWVEPNKLTTLDKYKEIFQFADSNAHMGLSSTEAKTFTDNWLKERNYQEFLYFKEVYTFADSNQNMGKSAGQALNFALRWIDKYSREDFDVFAVAFTFADSNSGMSMSEEEAEEFALKKVREHKKSANKPIQQTPKSGAADG